MIVIVVVILSTLNVVLSRCPFVSSTRNARGGGSYNHRHDATSVVTGNGDYWPSGPGWAHNPALLVVYEHPSIEGTFQIEIHDGFHGGVWGDACDGAWPNPSIP